jgi:hypothetical protein
MIDGQEPPRTARTWFSVDFENAPTEPAEKKTK